MSEAAPGDDDDDDDEGGGAVWEKQQERVTRTPWWRDLPGGSNSVGVVKEVGQLKWYRERAASAAEPVLPVDEGSAGDDDQSSEDSDAGSDGDDDADEMGEDGGSDAEHAEDALTTATARVKAHRPVTVKSTHRLPDGGVVVNTFSPTLPHRRSALSRGATVVGLPIPDVHSNVNGNPTHARPPVRRNTTTSHLAHGGGAGVNPGGMSKTLHRASSWFKPIQSWVETIGEVIAPTPSPDDQSQGRRTSVIDGGSGSLRRMPQPLLQNRARANSAVAVPRPYIVDTALSHPPPSPPANPQPHQLPHPLPRTYSAVSVASSKASSGATPGEEGKRQGGKKIRVRRCDVYQFDEAVGHADGAAKGDAATAPEPLGDSKDRSGAPTHDSRETRTDTSPPQPVSPPGTTPIPSTPPRESNADNGDPKPEDDFGEFESPVVDSPPPRRAETDAATE
ncbi:uncharacterized protein EV422DRAFT_520585 [Fimicolochytrium jonesii]|uniref:uncharacterized protein n=1 Tax=Fimicolochytrium jonesii TaxID=1396493 RepID=UPI0022FE0C31|nr:uncharacterized protein EV422DRAFT_520585 [Fimicolochytrium jonesii]KAI8824576.1 hypothetical protein EV422DRAFT_520585 [Fimicolochytrium jonesii]